MLSVQTFFHFVSLQTGAELICIFTVFNKASGLYGLLALLTGAHISAWQMSMYLYSILAAAAFAYSLRHIKAGPSSSLEIIAFSWFFFVDTVINFAYTALFATTWFLVLSQQPSGSTGAAMNESAGFTSPTHTVSGVTVIPTLAANGVQKTDFEVIPASQPIGLGEGVLQPEQLPSIVALVAILLFKLYFVLVIMSYAREIIKQVEGSSMSPYMGWRRQAYNWLTKGSYWPSSDTLRLSKSRSTRRSEEERR